MFIRSVRTRPGAAAGGLSYRLVHSQRSAGKVRQRILAHFRAGLEDRVPRQHWKQLAGAIRHSLAGQVSLLPLSEQDPEQEQLRQSLRAEVDEIVPVLRRRLQEQDHDLGLQVGVDPTPAEAPETVLPLLPASLRHTDVREAGAARLLQLVAAQLQLRQCFEQAGLRDRHVRLGMAQALARALHPASERETLRWLRQDSVLAELLGLQPGDLSSNSLYVASDALWKHREPIEKALFRCERTLFDLPTSIVFYDLTNTYHCGRPQHAYAAHGRSKQKRHDCPLVTLGLLMDRDGFPRRSEVLAGNVGEAGTLQKAVQRLGAGRAEDGPLTVIFDGGIVSEENLAWLREQDLHFITVQRQRQASPQRDPDTVWDSASGRELKIWRLSRQEAGLADASDEEQDGQDSEVRLCVWSPARDKDEQELLERQRGRFEQELQNLHEGLSIKRRLKSHEKVLRKLGRLEQRYRIVASHYKVTVEEGDRGRAKAVRWEPSARHGERDRMQGTSLLRTSRVDWDEARIVQEYYRLADIEATFRSLKEELGLRPLHHSLGKRVAGHLFITVLAYHLVHALRYRLRSQGLTYSWRSIRERMRTWVRLTTTMRTQEGKVWSQRQDVDPNNDQARIAAAAGLAFRRHQRTLDVPLELLAVGARDKGKDHKA